MDGGCMTTDLFPVMSGKTGPVPSLEDNTNVPSILTEMVIARSIRDASPSPVGGQESEQSLEEVLAEARRQSLTRDNPLLADLPDWFEGLRDHQRVAIREILTAYEEGAECVVLDAPTGSGKTLIGETVRRLLARTRSNGLTNQSTYICSSKALQDQFIRDYPYARVLKGRSNYATERYPERFGGRDGLSAADCTKTPGNQESCLWCTTTDACEYERAKSAALRASLAVLNTSYFLSECNGPGRFSRGGFVIADEADTLESELLSHVEVRISERRLKQYGLGVPRFVTKEESWREWAEDAYAKVFRKPPRHGLDTSDLVAVREAKRHALLVAKLNGLRIGLSNGGWVYTGDREAIAFKPIMVNHIGQDKLWQHGDRWLLMSATVISADEMLESLGWPDEKEWRLVKCPSTFKPENRKVVVWPCANVTRKTKDEAYPKLVEGVKTILTRHPNDRVLVHSTSYALTAMLEEGLREDMGWLAGRQSQKPLPLFTYSNPATKDAAVLAYKNTPGAVLLAPSLERGIDLPGDLCRVQILCKVPWKSMDRQTTARLYAPGGKIWYAVDAIRTLVQSCGRGVRSEDDWAISYILDEQFVSNLWGNYRRLFPEWWKQGLVWKVKGL